MLNSTQTFLQEIDNFDFKSNNVLVSYDVKSLFTNIPLSETIDIVANHIYSAKEHPKITKNIFIKLLKMATEGMFLYRDNLFKQVDGVAMGSPLGPTLANFFMAHIEQKIFKETLDYHPKLYSRYVDDIFAVFEDENSPKKFLNCINSLHPNLKFTMEKSIVSLPFLDVEVKLTDNDIETKVWRKPTHTNLLMNFSAFCPKSWKRGLILCLLHRAKLICSSQKLFLNEVSKLKKLFVVNAYPSVFFDETFNSFLKNISNVKLPDNSDYTLVIPFFGHPSTRLAFDLKKLFKKVDNFNIRFSYDTFKVGQYFQLKSRVPRSLCSNVVYKFVCPCDADISYIGMTSRHLSTRVSEHLSFGSSTLSAIKEHIMDCTTCSNSTQLSKSFEVLRQCRTEFETKIYEALFIKKFKPKLNKQVHASGMSVTLKIF